MPNPKKHVITGPPGSGKTTLVDGLLNHGVSVIDESARQIIEEQQGQLVPVTVMDHPYEFHILVVQRQLALESKMHGSLTVADRSLVDGMAYMNMQDMPYCPGLQGFIADAAYQSIFMLPPPPKEEYVQDEIRQETWEDSVRIYLRLNETYAALGFDVIHVQGYFPDGQLKFVMDRIL